MRRPCRDQRVPHKKRWVTHCPQEKQTRGTVRSSAPTEPQRSESLMWLQNKDLVSLVRIHTENGNGTGHSVSDCPGGTQLLTVCCLHDIIPGIWVVELASEMPSSGNKTVGCYYMLTNSLSLAVSHYLKSKPLANSNHLTFTGAKAKLGPDSEPKRESYREQRLLES